MHRSRPGFEGGWPIEPQVHPAPAAFARFRAGRAAALCAVVLLAAWAGAATLYILFRDDALKTIVARQIAITRSYETQAMQLQAEIDRLRSLKLIDQERVDRAIAELIRRQATLESRQTAIATVAGAAPAVSVSAGAPEISGSASAPPRAPAAAAPKPTPLSDTILVRPPVERQARLESRPVPRLGAPVFVGAADTATEVRVKNLARELAAVEHAQIQALNRIEESLDGREDRLRRVFSDLGLKVRDGSFVAHLAGLATGGPFLPWPRSAEDPFVRQINRIRATERAIRALRKEIATVPVLRPTAGETDVTSAFGMRLDPFVRQIAMHTGVDFRGDPGDPVRAAAAGRVAAAERNGGYGLMVEIDHGDGITTRYAHLSTAIVREGAAVAAGSVVGRIGSSGRSTGPHLHYEVRINGEAVDPQKFLRAGLRLGTP